MSKSNRGKNPVSMERTQFREKYRVVRESWTAATMMSTQEEMLGRVPNGRIGARRCRTLCNSDPVELDNWSYVVAKQTEHTQQYGHRHAALSY